MVKKAVITIVKKLKPEKMDLLLISLFFFKYHHIFSTFTTSFFSGNNADNLDDIA